jgi:hypothetical protein
MKLSVCDRARRTAHIVTVHSQDKADDTARVRKRALDVRSFSRQRRMINLHKTDVIRACI